MSGCRVSLRNPGFLSKMEGEVTPKENPRFKKRSLFVSQMGQERINVLKNPLSVDCRAIQLPIVTYLQLQKN